MNASTTAPATPVAPRRRLRDELNFLVTNRIPRRMATRLAGWYARIESRALTRVSIAVWQRFGGDLALHEAESRDFTSVHACFTRRLRPGARAVARGADVLVSPCDAIVGACGRIDAGTLVQAKGLTYRLDELVADGDLARRHRGGWFVTLRLRSTMYHRFHAPCDVRLTRVRYIAGDTWNVNPVAVARIARLFCRNARAVLDFELRDERCALTLVPVAAILVASIRLHALPQPLNHQSRGAVEVALAHESTKGDELGYFENGSTIIVLVSGPFTLAPEIREGMMIRMGEPLLHGDGIALSRVTAPLESDMTPPPVPATPAPSAPPPARGPVTLARRLAAAIALPRDYPPHFPTEDYHA